MDTWDDRKDDGFSGEAIRMWATRGSFDLGVMPAGRGLSVTGAT